MKKCSWLVILLLSTFFLNACKSDETETEEDLDLAENYDTFQPFNLAPFDIPANLMLPGPTANIGASLKPEVKYKEGGFKWDVSVGPNFSLHIEDWGANQNLVADHKEKLKELEMYEIVFLVDKPDLVIYQSKLKVSGAPNAPENVGFPHEAYHVYGEKTINDITYEFRSPDGGYEKRYIELMAKTIQSIKENQQ
ncbi:MAG: hypothetical protein N4A41_01095 [Crocinitomicaceae bacterium]|jgi:hypothetical protein|nr:hypothetical protein [Crocinitomicaceae bacterium]